MYEPIADDTGTPSLTGAMAIAAAASARSSKKKKRKNGKGKKGGNDAIEGQWNSDAATTRMDDTAADDGRVEGEPATSASIAGRSSSTGFMTPTSINRVGKSSARKSKGLRTSSLSSLRTNATSTAVLVPSSKFDLDHAAIELAARSSPNKWEKKKPLGESANAAARLTSILNKLAPEKCEKLLSATLSIQVTEAETLQAFVGIIFEKACNEPHFAPLYAKLCRRIETHMPEFPTSNPRKPMTFRTLLLTKCHHTLIADPPDLSSLSHLPEADREEAEAKTKGHRRGNIVLIGELYKHHILPHNVIRLCMLPFAHSVTFSSLFSLLWRC
jgi:hypothetical protein